MYLHCDCVVVLWLSFKFENMPEDFVHVSCIVWMRCQHQANAEMYHQNVTSTWLEPLLPPMCRQNSQKYCLMEEIRQTTRDFYQNLLQTIDKTIHQLMYYFSHQHELVVSTHYQKNITVVKNWIISLGLKMERKLIWVAAFPNSRFSQYLFHPFPNRGRSEPRIKGFKSFFEVVISLLQLPRKVHTSQVDRWTGKPSGFFSRFWWRPVCWVGRKFWVWAWHPQETTKMQLKMSKLQKGTSNFLQFFGNASLENRMIRAYPPWN